MKYQVNSNNLLKIMLDNLKTFEHLNNVIIVVNTDKVC
jgi:hypothetical protein